ncbi:fatty acid--CoA ligase [Sphingomonas oligophenolica]|uniref:Long-chain-fatty-acid--CoA ligase n=1 Tax=Sphingomonas oligophenolica TaxID=301154 RepID=A0ABU9Y916_9SPHN
MSLKFVEAAAGHVPTGLLIRHILEGAVATAAEQEIVYRDRFRYTYAAMAERVHRLASALSALGVGEGTTVAVMDWDSHRYLEAYFAVPMMGAVLQTVNVRLSRAQLVHCLASTGATHLIFHADFATLVADILPDLPELTCHVLIDENGAVGMDGVAGEYEVLLAAASPPFAFVDFDENAVATTFHTTGTTGLPKAVAFSHRQIVLHALALATTMGWQPVGQGLRRDDVYMPLTPMFHVHAWGLPLVATMACIKQVYPGRYEPALIIDLKVREGVSFSHCVPTVLRMILDAADTVGMATLAPWAMLVGGSALPEALQNAATRSGITTFAGYGMSETGPVVAIARSAGENSAELRRAGRLVPLVAATTVDAEMMPQPRDGISVGELVLRAPWLTACYPGDSSSSDDLWRGGWLHTQDIATITSNGTVEIRDRLKDVIKSGGEWISSVQLEDLMLRHPLVKEAAVIGVPDPHWGERPIAFIVIDELAQAAEAIDSLGSLLAEHAATGQMPRFAVPARFECIDCLPKTSVGKIDKRELRNRTS